MKTGVNGSGINAEFCAALQTCNDCCYLKTFLGLVVQLLTYLVRIYLLRVNIVFCTGDGRHGIKEETAPYEGMNVLHIIQCFFQGSGGSVVG